METSSGAAKHTPGATTITKLEGLSHRWDERDEGQATTRRLALLHDANVELELLLALVLPALKPAAEDLQEGGASSKGGQAGDGSVNEVAHARGARDLQVIAGLRERLTCVRASCRGDRPPLVLAGCRWSGARRRRVGGAGRGADR